MIEERHKRQKEENKNKILHKINNERLRYCKSLDQYIIKKKEEEALRQEKSFKKYQNFVSNKYYLIYQ